MLVWAWVSMWVKEGAHLEGAHHLARVPRMHLHTVSAPRIAPYAMQVPPIAPNAVQVPVLAYAMRVRRTSRHTLCKYWTESSLRYASTGHRGATRSSRVEVVKSTFGHTHPSASHTGVHCQIP
eukprot:3026068-Rhodomonas_salina.1